MQGIASGWGTFIPFQDRLTERDGQMVRVVLSFFFYFIPILSDSNEANYPCEVTLTLDA